MMHPFSYVLARKIFAPIALALLAPSACTNITDHAPHVPGPASSVTRAESLRIADAYARLRWTPEKRHILHGRDRDGMEVQTPDRSLDREKYGNGWWMAGRNNTGMPYMWGGFDTPDLFLQHLASGKRAGDVTTPEKRRLGDAAVSRDTCGIDCSGFVSRCWKLDHPVSTRELPAICEPLPDWDALQAGDILLNGQHVLLFAGWQVPGKVILGYEAGPKPVWRVNACGLEKRFLQERGYAPWRYRNMRP